MSRHKKESQATRIVKWVEDHLLLVWAVAATVIIAVGVVLALVVGTGDPQPQPTPTVTVKVTETKTVTPAPTPKASKTVPAGGYLSCEDAKAAGALPLKRGDVGYRRDLDIDQDGTACEGD